MKNEGERLCFEIKKTIAVHIPSDPERQSNMAIEYFPLPC